MDKNNITYLLREVMKKAHALAASNLMEHDLTFAQYQALMLMRYNDSLSMSDITRKLLITQPGATNLVNKLVKKHLVKRDYSSRDRRKVIVTSTEKGRKILEEFSEGHEKFVKSLCEKIGEKDLEIIQRSLKILLDAI